MNDLNEYVKAILLKDAADCVGRQMYEDAAALLAAVNYMDGFRQE